MRVQLASRPVGSLTRREATSAADLLGVAEERGTLEAGKLADVIAVDGDPLGDMGAMERVVFVMKEGQVFKRVPAVSATR